MKQQSNGWHLPGAPVGTFQLTWILNNAVAPGTPITDEQLCWILNNIAPVRGHHLHTNLPFFPWQFRPRPVNSFVWNWQLNFEQFIQAMFMGVQFPLLIIRRAGGSNAQF